METKAYTSPPVNKQPTVIVEVIEAFDLEWKIFYTFRDFIKKPEMVISSFRDGQKKYSNPVKLVITCGAVYWLITSYFVDWKAVGIIVGEAYGEFLKSFLLLIDNDPERATRLSELVTKMKSIAAGIFRVLMQYLGLYVVAMALGISSVLYWITRKNGTSIREILGFQCYRLSFFIVILLLLLPFGYISYWIPILLLFGINLYVEHFNKSRKFSIFPYLKVPKKEARKYLFKSIAIFLLLMVFIGIIAGFILGRYILE